MKKSLGLTAIAILGFCASAFAGDLSGNSANNPERVDDIENANIEETSFQDFYAAIAISQQTGATGWSRAYATQVASERAALRQCESFAGTGDCVVAVWVRNACASLAVGLDNAYGWAWNSSVSIAQTDALTSCSEVTTRCKIRETVCSH